MTTTIAAVLHDQLLLIKGDYASVSHLSVVGCIVFSNNASLGSNPRDLSKQHSV